MASQKGPSSRADDGFDAVEIDNLDTWTRFSSISKQGAFALASAYVAAPHDLALAIAQRNAAEANLFFEAVCDVPSARLSPSSATVSS